MILRLLPFVFILLKKRKISFSKIVNLSKNFFYGFILRKKTLNTLPSFLMIEPSNMCNLHCKGCAFQLTGGRPASLPRKMMSFSVFKKMIDEAEKSCIFLFLYMGGESFLNKDLFKMIRYANNKKIFTLIATNGSFAHVNNFGSRVVDSGLDALIFSISGTKQSFYQKFHRGGKLSLVTNNIKQVIKAKKDLAPYVLVRYLAIKENEKDWKNIRSFVGKLGVNNYEIRKVDGDLVLSDGVEDKKANKKVTGRYCFWLWLGMVIRVDGDIIPCCYDYYGVPVLGKLEEDRRITDIWQGKAYNNFRKIWLSNRNLSCCSQCRTKLGFQDKASEGIGKIYVKKSK